MQITLPVSTLLQSLEIVSRISTIHATLPVLQCVLFSVSDDSITLTATNLELGVETALTGEITQAGTAAVPAQTLLQVVQNLKESRVSLSVQEEVLRIKSKSGETTINTMSAEEFPTVAKLDTVGQKINRTNWVQGIKTVAFAASQTSIKPELGSVLILQKKEQSLTFVATDSFRLMEKTNAQTGVTFEESLLIPHKNATEIARLCDQLEENPTLHRNENQCTLQFLESGVYVTSRLVAGSFPDYEQIIPKEYVTHTTLLKNDLLQSFRRTQVFLNKFSQVNLKVQSDAVYIASQNGEVGATEDMVSAESDGEELDLNFNQQYLIDPLTHIKDEQLQLHFAGVGRPMVMTGSNDTSLRYLVMPMNK